MQEQLKRKGNKKLCPIAIIVREGKMLMGYRHYTPDKWKKISVWTCPGGRCDHGENVEQALRREVKEETGISDLRIVEYIGETKGAKDGDKILVFFCDTEQTPRLMEPQKFSEWRWLDLENHLEDSLGVFNPHAQELVIDFLLKRGFVSKADWEE